MSEERVTKVKVCGITRTEDVHACVELGVDWLGLNFWPRSKRAIDREQGAALAHEVRARDAAVAIVGVFVDQPIDDMRAIADAVGLSWLQLHGHESPSVCRELVDLGYRVVKAMGLSSAADAERLAGYPGDMVLADTPCPGFGGSGQTFDWQLLADSRLRQQRSVILAGGLRADNVGAAIAMVRPVAVDIASGVESAPGIKDANRIAALLQAVAAADAQLAARDDRVGPFR